MVGLVVGQVKPEQVEALVDGLGKPESMSEGVQGSDPSDRESACTFGNLLVDVAGGQDGLAAAA